MVLRLTAAAFCRGRLVLPLAAAAFSLIAAGPAIAQPPAPPTAECCEHKELAAEYGIIWAGQRSAGAAALARNM